MHIFKNSAVAGLAIAVTMIPALALAQSYDNEGAEGSCNDEMNESMTCGNTYSNYSYTTSPYSSYSAPAQYYSPTSYSSGSYGMYGTGAYSYIPAAAMPYVQMGYQMQQQSEQQYAGYYPTYQSQSQSQSQSQYQSYTPTYTYPTYSYSTQNYSIPSGYYSSEPQVTSYPSGTYGPFGTKLCYWSDYPTYAPCNQDPQQWVQDPYTGEWY